MYIVAVVTPSAKKERVVAEDKTTLAISVRERASGNMANNRVREIVAAHYEVLVKEVRLISGHRSRKKVFSVQKSTTDS